MRVVEDKQIHEALKVIVASQTKATDWAVNYAKAGLDMHGEDLRLQCVYILGNIVNWRGEDAKQVRTLLKDFVNRVED